MDLDWWVLFGVTAIGIVASALYLYFGLRGTMLALGVFAAFVASTKLADLRGPVPMLLLVFLMAAAYIVEMRARLTAFHALADALGANWRSGGDSVLGVIEGTFNGRKFRMDHEERGEGRSSENWLQVTVACTAAGSPTDYVLHARAEGFVQVPADQERFAQAVEAAKQRLYGERRLLEPLAIRMLHAGKLGPGGHGILWSNAGYINFERLPAILECLDAIAGAIEKDAGDANRATS